MRNYDEQVNQWTPFKVKLLYVHCTTNKFARDMFIHALFMLWLMTLIHRATRLVIHRAARLVIHRSARLVIHRAARLVIHRSARFKGA